MSSDEGFAPANAPAPIGERRLDTSTPAAPVAPPPTAVVQAAPTPAPVTTYAPPRNLIKAGSDEHLPRWVPVRGRLSVVDSSDLAENLGLAPKGSSRNADTRITVADALAQKPVQTAAAPVAAQNAPQNPTSATWLAANGRFRSRGRGR